MDIDKIKNNLNESGKFKVRDVNYKYDEDKQKYGTSFEAITDNDFELVKVNDETYKAKRIIEEFGLILLIHDFKQVEFKPEDISSITVLG